MKIPAQFETDPEKQLKFYDHSKSNTIFISLAKNEFLSPEMQIILAQKLSFDVRINLAGNNNLIPEAQTILYNSIDFEKARRGEIVDFEILYNLSANNNLYDILQLDMLENDRHHEFVKFNVITNRNLSLEVFELKFLEYKNLILQNKLNYKNNKINEKIEKYLLLI